MAMDNEKLKSIAYMSLQGTENERKIASKLLAKHGITAHEILSDAKPIKHNKNDSQPIDINELSQMFCDEMLGKLESFSENLIDSLDSLRIIFRHILK